jgi:hypothetical protein
MRKSILMISALMVLLACGGKKTTAEVTDSANSDSLAKEEITSCIHNLYAAAAKNASDIDGSFACHAWRDTVAAVEKKDVQQLEIGFFNDDYWTWMQDDNPDDLEARDIQFEQLDVEKGTATVGFMLYSSVQTVHMMFRFCREDGDWRVHDIIRYNTESDGKETATSFMEAMQNYLNEETSEDGGDELM